MPSRWLGRLVRGAWTLLRRLARFVRLAVPRVYAFGLILLIGWLTFLALRYLVVSLATPAPAPPQITGLPARLDRTVLGTGRSAWQALSAVENARSPLAHYHRLDNWLSPDRFNDCARSGCHSPLPHFKHKEVRAFLNMHATSVHCGVCHMQIEQTPRPLVWYDLTDGAAAPTPAILQAYAILTGGAFGSPPGKGGLGGVLGERDDDPSSSPLSTGVPSTSLTAEQQHELVRLLKAAAQQAGDVPELISLADHFAAIRPGSTLSVKLISEARETLPRHFRGEYGAKLAIRDDRGAPILGHPNTAQAIRAYFAQKDAATPETRARLLEAVHPLRRKTALVCTDCHRTEGSLVDFAAAGYPLARIETLVSPIVFRMVEHIAEGRPFHMP